MTVVWLSNRYYSCIFSPNHYSIQHTTPAARNIQNELYRWLVALKVKQGWNLYRNSRLFALVCVCFVNCSDFISSDLALFLCLVRLHRCPLIENICFASLSSELKQLRWVCESKITTYQFSSLIWRNNFFTATLGTTFEETTIKIILRIDFFCQIQWEIGAWLERSIQTNRIQCRRDLYRCWRWYREPL